MNNAARIEIDGEPTTWGEFVDDNINDVTSDEFAAMATALLAHGWTVYDGGAGGSFDIRLAARA